MSTKLSPFAVVSQEVLRECENFLGIYKVVNGSSTSLELLDVKNFIVEFRERTSKLSEEELTKIKSGCGYYIATLCYTNSELNFRREMVLDFKKHTRADLLCRLLVPFLKRENQTKDVMKNIEYISKYLSVLELKDKRFKKTLTYRFIRLFVCFILIGDLSHASMTADFVIQQAFLSEGVDNAVRQNIKDLLDARGRVDEMFDSYTGAAGNSGSSFNSAKEKLKTVARNVKDTVESEYFKN